MLPFLVAFGAMRDTALRSPVEDLQKFHLCCGVGPPCSQYCGPSSHGTLGELEGCDLMGVKDDSAGHCWEIHAVGMLEARTRVVCLCFWELSVLYLLLSSKQVREAAGHNVVPMLLPCTPVAR